MGQQSLSSLGQSPSPLVIIRTQKPKIKEPELPKAERHSICIIESIQIDSRDKIINIIVPGFGLISCKIERESLYQDNFVNYFGYSSQNKLYYSIISSGDDAKKGIFRKYEFGEYIKKIKPTHH